MISTMKMSMSMSIGISIITTPTTSIAIHIATLPLRRKRCIDRAPFSPSPNRHVLTRTYRARSPLIGAIEELELAMHAEEEQSAQQRRNILKERKNRTTLGKSAPRDCTHAQPGFEHEKMRNRRCGSETCKRSRQRGSAMDCAAGLGATPLAS